MKQSPTQFDQARRLGRSKFSAEGFMGTDSRTVEEIVAEDVRSLKELGVDKNDLIMALGDAYQKTRAALGGEVRITHTVSGVFHESMGKIPSPFRGDGVFEKGEAALTDRATGETLIITSSHPHAD